MSSNKPLNGIKIIDFTHVQAGPACTQMLAWFGADVIKVERPGSGDVTRTQLRDIPDVDALYFTMLNSNKRSLTLDTKKPEGKAVLEKLIRESDVLVENFGPGALDRMGFTWERIQELNPKMILASVKGFSDGHHYEDLKVYENVAQCAGGAASTTGWWKGENSAPTITRRRAGRLQHRHAPGDRHPDGHHRPPEDRQGPEGRLLDAGRRAQPVPREDARPAAPGQARLPRGVPAVPARDGSLQRQGGAARRQCRRRRPAGLDPEVQGLGDRPQRLHLLHRAGPRLGADLRRAGQARVEDRPRLHDAARRASRTSTEIFATIEDFIKDKTKFEAVDIFRKFDIPCAPVLSMKELLHDESLRKSGSIVEVPHKERGNYWTIGSPIKFSDLKPEVTASPLLGEHTDEVLAELGYTKDADRQAARSESGLKLATSGRALEPAVCFWKRALAKRGRNRMPTNIDLKQLVAGAGDAIIVCDAEGAIVLWNQAAERIFGFTEAEALGQSLDLIIPERQRQRHWDGYDKTMETGITKYGADLLRVPALHKDGRTAVDRLHGVAAASPDRKGHAASPPSCATRPSRFAEDRKLRARLDGSRTDVETKEELVHERRRHWRAFASSISPTCSRARPARSCWPGSAPT